MGLSTKRIKEIQLVRQTVYLDEKSNSMVISVMENNTFTGILFSFLHFIGILPHTSTMQVDKMRRFVPRHVAIAVSVSTHSTRLL